MGLEVGGRGMLMLRLSVYILSFILHWAGGASRGKEMIES